MDAKHHDPDKNAIKSLKEKIAESEKLYAAIKERVESATLAGASQEVLEKLNKNKVAAANALESIKSNSQIDPDSKEFKEQAGVIAKCNIDNNNTIEKHYKDTADSLSEELQKIFTQEIPQNQYNKYPGKSDNEIRMLQARDCIGKCAALLCCTNSLNEGYHGIRSLINYSLNPELDVATIGEIQDDLSRVKKTLKGLTQGEKFTKLEKAKKKIWSFC
ncbi:hypothetical protein [Aquimarina sp. MMG016]|uniref:hypothetical protein n=1 Tax=Aquimarina sp. MMG016 TaxID=2822690 RepID=UPI001B3A5521|nr:hypothetical protein [Aquimarina sp. MMG016]MBQ4820599.1 hypothetical protein [Aquimarina sp. MMG016]